MAYQKPGVSVRQVQRTASFPLPDPTLESCVLGEGYYWQDPSREDEAMNSVFSGSYDGSQLEIPVSYFTSYSDIVPDTVYIDLVRKTGVSGDPGEITSLETTDFSVTAGTITIDAGAPGYSDVSDSASVRVGFLSENTDIAGTFAKIKESNDIKTLITGGSTPEWFNPLAYGASIAQANSGRSVNVIGVARGAAGDTGDYAPAVAQANLREKLYALAPLTGQSAEAELFDAHVTTASLPVNKKERIAFTSRFNNSYTDPATDADAIKAYSAGIGNKRYFNIWPEAVYVNVTTHISTLYSGFIQAVFGTTFDISPKLARNTEIGGKTYAVDTELTTALLNSWKAELSNPYVNVDVAVPGFYLGAALAGVVSAKGPAEPLTNSSVSGFTDVYRSNDYFDNSEMNTIAAGGTWIFENKGAGAITTRHQLSTNATTIETRELSITTQIDFSAKYLRELVSPLIGKFVITDGFINNLRSALHGGAEQLVDQDVVRDLNVINVYQDEVNPDTVKADIELLPLYPVNYIKLTLTF